MNKSGSHNYHASESASGADRWATCTASSAFIAKLRADGVLPEKDGSSIYAEEGTRAHDFAEAWLSRYLKGLDTPDLPEEFSELQSYLDTCIELSYEGHAYVEEIVPLWYSPGETGTCDFLVYHDDESVSSRDLKWGQGDYTAKIRNKNNRQLAIYTYSALINNAIIDGVIEGPENTSALDNLIINMAIEKPRVTHTEPPWVLPFAELREFVRHIEFAKQRIDEGDVEFKPSSEACRWCPAKMHCKARMTQVVEVLPVDMDNASLNDSQRVMFFKLIPQINKLIKDVVADLESRPTAPPGLKYKAGKKTRCYRDVEEVGKWLTKVIGYDEAFEVAEPKLISMTAAEKKLTTSQKKDFQKLLTMTAAKPKLVSEDDVSPAVKTLKEDMFNFN